MNQKVFGLSLIVLFIHLHRGLLIRYSASYLLLFITLLSFLLNVYNVVLNLFELLIMQNYGN